MGQLLVWEWRSESYVLKQQVLFLSSRLTVQGHAFDMRVLAFSPDSQLIATGGDDAKVSSLQMLIHHSCGMMAHSR
jgi:periodic tryptophan protein 2